ncbi:hypothetical protein LCGC14_1210590, partial [marine sediment metagenome]
SETNLNREGLALEKSIAEQVNKSFQDTPFIGLTKKSDASKAELATALSALRTNDNVLLGTVALEHLPPTRIDLLDMLKTRDGMAAKMRVKLEKLQKEFDKNLDEVNIDEINIDKSNKLLKQMDDARKELDELQGLEFYVIERGGEVVDARGRKPLFHDNPGKIEVQRATTIEPRIFKIKAPPDPVSELRAQVIGVTEDLQILLPASKTIKVSGINVTRILEPKELHAPENFKILLRDIAEDWHLFERGGKAKKNRGQEILQNLPSDIQMALRDWVNSAERSAIREWFAEGDPRAVQLFEAFAPLRERLANIADADGTIPLLRGETKRSFKDPRNDVVSMTSDPGVAENFGEGKNIIVRRVPVDDIIAVVGGLGKEFEYIVKGNTKRNIGEIITRTSFESLTLYQRSAAYFGLQRAIDSYTPGKFKINIASGDHHTRLDAVLELHDKHGASIFQDIKLPSGLQNVDDLEFASLSSKFDEYVRLRTVQDQARAGSIKIPEERIMTSEDIRKMLNLPGTANGDIHPLMSVFEAFYQQGDKLLRDAVGTFDNLRRAVQEDAFTLAQTQTAERILFQFRGNMLRIDLNKKPFVVLKRPLANEQVSRDFLVEAVTRERARVLVEMSQAANVGADLVQIVSDTLAGLPDLVRVAKNVDSLIEGSQRGRGAIITQVFAFGENPTLQAMHNAQLLTDKAFRKASGEIFKQHIPTFNKLKNPNNRADLVSLNLYVHARRQAWDIGDVIPMEGSDNLFAFPLAKTRANQARFKKMFGREMPDGAIMPSQTKIAKRPGRLSEGITAGDFFEYKPLGMTELALTGARAVDDLDQTLLRNINFIRKLMGRGELRAKPWHVPPRNFGRQTVAYVMTPSGELQSVVPGRNLGDARRKAEQIARETGGTSFIIDQKDIARHFQIQDEAFERMMDFTDPLRQTGKAKGTQVGAVVDVGESALNDMINSIERNFESVLRRSRAVFFEPEINYARKRFEAAGAQSAAKGQSVWQQYLASIFGNPTLNPNDMIGTSYFAIESLYDDVLNVLFDKHMAFFSPGNVEKVRASRRQNKTYVALEKQLGEHNPFRDSVDFANRTHNVQIPGSMKKHMARLNAFTSLLTLRLFEVGHSILTLSSLGATMPGVVAGMKRIVGETEEQFSARIGAFGQVIDKDVAMWSPTKAIVSGTHFMFTEEGHKVWKRASEAGFMDQQVAEIFRTITAPSEGYWEGIIRRSTNMVSVLSDQSERLARGISFMTGYNYAKKALGLADEKVLFAFANDFANKVIGDYSPNNRPRIFQGAAGMPLGLFMTFMWNYYQRIFGYIENGQTRALVTQFATQAAVFGGETIPGFNQYNDFFFTNWDGTANPVDAMNNRFGPEFSEWFLNGVLSNLPKMAGFEDGIGLSTRGDVNFRNIPTMFTFQDTPVFAMFKDFTNATKASFGRLRTQGKLTVDDLAEIAQSYSTNRALRNIGTLYTGYATDRRGQVIAESPSFGDIIRGEVENEVGLMARLAGLRTLDEKRRVEASFKNRTTDISRRYRLGNLRSVVRTQLRAGKFGKDELNDAITYYVKFGGSPNYFPRWLAQQFLTSKVDKSALELMKIINNPQKSDQALRLLSVLGTSVGTQ